MAENKRIQILDSAAVIFSKHGFHGAKMGDIAKGAGIGKGTIYRYFESKETLFQELIRYGMEEYKEGMRKVLNREGNCKEKIIELFKYHGYYLGKHIDITQVVINQEGLMPKKLKEEMVNEKMELLAMIEELLDRGKNNKELRENLDVGLAALSIIGSISNFYGKELYYNRKEFKEICPGTMVDLLFEGFN